MLSLLLAAGCAAAIVIFSDSKHTITKGITSAYGDFKDGASKRLVLDNERPEFLKSEDKSAKTEDSNNNNGDKEISWYKEIFGTIYKVATNFDVKRYDDGDVLKITTRSNSEQCKPGLWKSWLLICLASVFDTVSNFTNRQIGVIVKSGDYFLALATAALSLVLSGFMSLSRYCGKITGFDLWKDKTMDIRNDKINQYETNDYARNVIDSVDDVVTGFQDFHEQLFTSIIGVCVGFFCVVNGGISFSHIAFFVAFTIAKSVVTWLLSHPQQLLSNRFKEVDQNLEAALDRVNKNQDLLVGQLYTPDNIAKGIKHDQHLYNRRVAVESFLLFVAIIATHDHRQTCIHSLRSHIEAGCWLC